MEVCTLWRTHPTLQETYGPKTFPMQVLWSLIFTFRSSGLTYEKTCNVRFVTRFYLGVFFQIEFSIFYTQKTIVSIILTKKISRSFIVITQCRDSEMFYRFQIVIYICIMFQKKFENTSCCSDSFENDIRTVLDWWHLNLHPQDCHMDR